MYKIGNYEFENFKYRPGHRANYGILTKPGKEWGMKYSPTYSYDREYEVLKNFSHSQIPKRYESGTGRGELYENDKLVLNSNLAITTLQIWFKEINGHVIMKGNKCIK
jgi:hypothetical protein